MWSMLVQTRLDRVFSQAASMADTSYTSTAQRGPKFTLVVPSNSAWEKAQMNFHKSYNTLLDGQIPQYVSNFSLDQSVTKNQILNTKCKPKFFCCHVISKREEARLFLLFSNCHIWCLEFGLHLVTG